jgi:hypothetical protein
MSERVNLEAEDIDDDMAEVAEDVWYYVENDEGRRLESFNDFEEAAEFVEDRDDMTEDDIIKTSRPVGIRDFGVSAGQPIDTASSQLELFRDGPNDEQKEALIEAIDSTYEILEELEEVLVGDKEVIEHPLLRHSYNDYEELPWYNIRNMKDE